MARAPQPTEPEATDLESAVPRGAPPPAFPPQGGVQDAAYDPSRDRETKRGQIAINLVTLLVVLAVAPFVLVLARALCFRTVAGEDVTAVCAGFPSVDLIELLNTVLTPVVALVGAATGFYFGEKKG